MDNKSFIGACEELHKALCNVGQELLKTWVGQQLLTFVKWLSGKLQKERIP